MESIIVCPACGQKMRLANEWLGQVIACPSCQHEFTAKAAPVGAASSAPASRKSASPAGPETSRTQRIPPSPGDSRIRMDAAPMPRNEDRTVIAPLSAKQQRAKTSRFTPIPVGAVVEADSGHSHKGNYRGQIAPEGLQLTGRAGELFVPVGSSAEYVSESALRVLVGNAWIELRLTRKGLNVKKLAADLADYLNGTRPSLKASDYEPSKVPVLIATILAVVGGLGLLVGIGLVIWSLMDEKWTTFSSPAGRFAVEMPGTPKESTKQVPVPIGPPLNATEFRYRSGTLEYLVEYVDLPMRMGIDFLHNGMQGEIAKDIPGGSLKSANKLNNTTYEYQISIDPRGHATRRLIIEGNRVYVLTIAGPNLRPGEDRISRFMDSFRVTGS
jgi:hypothetical protein